MASRSRKTARDKLQREFVSEAEEILERMRDDLSALAEAGAGKGEPPPETVNRLFRSAHSLKGLSGMFGHAALSELAHHLEDVLDRLRLGRTTLGRDGLGLLDESVSLAAAGLEKVGRGEVADALAERIADLVGRIAGWDAPARASGELASVELPESLLRALTEYEESRLRDNLRHRRGLAVIEVELELASLEESLSELGRAIGEVGELISTLPSPGAASESRIRFTLLAASPLAAPELAARLELEPGAVRSAHAAPGATHGRETPARSAEPAEVDTVTLKSLSETVRVDIRKLDELMNLMGDLAQERAALRALAVRLAAERATSRAATELEKISRGLDRKLQELQAGVLDVRMVPLRQVFDKLARVVRRLRLDLGKDVRLELQGAETELDKLIVEQLVDPLMHLVRNAFDHAIEPAAERARLGKPAEGVIRIEASQRGNDVAISVRDDGRGIDPEQVRARAIAAGLVAEDAGLSRKEAFGLLFQPGFSTRSEVTPTSGRGVGLDVVRANVSALGGLIDLESIAGAGTCVTLTLPITLAIVQALLVGVGSQRFAIPLGGIRETLLVSPNEIERSAGRELLNLRGEALPVRRLAEEFALGASDPTQRQYAVVLGIGEAKLALLVDRLEGQQDAVIKPVSGPVASVRGVAGASELGDRSAVLVLDVSALVEDARTRDARDAAARRAS